MYDNVTLITVGGAEFCGLIALAGGWWIAFASADESRTLRLVREDGSEA